MAVRSFNGTSDNVTCAIGSLADLRDGNLTIAAIVKLTDTVDAGIVEFHGSPALRCGLVHGSTSTYPIGLQDDGGGAFVGPPPTGASGVWCLVAITRSAGTIRAHVYNFNTTTWTHTAGSTVTAVNDTLTSVRLGGLTFGFFGGLIALAGAQVGTAHSDVNLETLTGGLQDWLDLFTGNAAVWPLNQTVTTDPVLDIVGAADQTALSGTTVTTGDDPPGFDFSLGPPPPTSAPQRLTRSRRVGRRLVTTTIWVAGGFPEVGGGPFTIPVGEATETETAQAVGKLKVTAVGQSAETETAQAITPRKSRAVGQATETETAQAIGKAKVKAVAAAAEAETAQAVGRVKTRAVGSASETETAQGIVVAGGQIAPATETETASLIGVRKTAAVGQATEVEQAQPITVRKSRVIGQATEAEAAQPLAKAKVKAVTGAAETETAQTIGRRKTRAVGHAAEAEQAQAIQPLGAKIIPIGAAVETETAQPLAKAKRRAVTHAAETETTQAVAKRRAYAVGVALELEEAQVIAPTGGAAAPRWVEHDATSSGHVEGVLVGAGIVEGSSSI